MLSENSIAFLQTAVIFFHLTETYRYNFVDYDCYANSHFIKYMRNSYHLLGLYLSQRKINFLLFYSPLLHPPLYTLIHRSDLLDIHRILIRFLAIYVHTNKITCVWECAICFWFKTSRHLLHHLPRILMNFIYIYIHASDVNFYAFFVFKCLFSVRNSVSSFKSLLFWKILWTPTHDPPILKMSVL